MSNNVAEAGTERAQIPRLWSEDTPIGERIDKAYDQSLASAFDAAKWVLVAGDMLIQQRAGVPDGDWVKWLEQNCKKVSMRTAYRLMKAAAYVHENGSFDAQTVRQLYLEAGVIKSSDDQEGDPPPARSILLPIQDAFKKFRLFYTDKRLAKLNPVAVPQLLGWVRDAKSELISLEERLLKRMPVIDVPALPPSRKDAKATAK